MFIVICSLKLYIGGNILTWWKTSKSFVENKAVGLMKPGHTFTIEPMISAGMALASKFYNLATTFCRS